MLRILRAYLELTKPRILELLLVTTIPVMVFAADGLPDLGMVAAVLLGGALSAGAAGAFNMYLERESDALMERTAQRPLVTGIISPRAGLIFAWVLAATSVVWMLVAVGPLPAALSTAGLVLYVVLYTLVLKRRTEQNVVWGGIAGCMPVFIGWAAVTDSLSWAAVALFGVIFFWTPPHYWPLSVKFKKDYANAGVPMLPVVATDRRVAIEMVAHTVAMIACSLVLVPLAGMSWFYTAVAVLSGGWFLYLVIAMLRRAGHPERGKLGAMKVFHGSITYLTVLFIAVAVDVFLPF